MARLQRKTYYTKRDGKVVKLSSSEIKRTIMRANNWDEATYRKQYDIFKNKLRAYEAFRASQGINERQNVIDVLYKQANAKLRNGDAYTPSMKMQQIQSFSAYSITKGRQMAKKESYQKRQTEKYDAYIERRFGDFIKANAQAQEISDYYKDNPAKREAALAKFATEIKAKQDATGKVEQGEAVPKSGEAHGYEEIDFDYVHMFDE